MLQNRPNKKRTFAERTVAEMFSRPKGCKTGIRGLEKTVAHHEVNKITRTYDLLKEMELDKIDQLAPSRGKTRDFCDNFNL